MGAKRRGPATRAASVLLTPLAPLFGAFLAYRIYHPPRRRHHRSPADYDLPATELVLPLPDRKGSLHLWVCEGDPDRVVVVGHGIGLSKSASLPHAKFLHEAGYTVVLFDHRNHGRSSQDASAFGLSARFTSDVAAVVDHFRGRAAHAGARFAVWGFSFSTFPILYVPMRGRTPVAAIICDSGPAVDTGPLFRNFLDTGALPIPAPFLVGPARWLVEPVFAGLSAAMVRARWPPPAERYDGIGLLFLAGERDAIVPASAVGAVAARYPHAEHRVIPGAEHLQGVKADPDLYQETVLSFLERNLG
ncbi:alpha/beta hydrolase [Saccharothrix algeriensis]|uniref:Alpha-beta hydrolase superfamily lysophospholipase n=1 Tax=Saccharothrix algeriensis TaxID=173560 RepID=A0ABS2S290_9PSEU|nr:alpha/beta fold hydrolase [Saccharothrix algeriensis]MBM7810362.1 alpha-beta hydrolase superfamily lysophospholipase [Saccharothrix algeriensis]